MAEANDTKVSGFLAKLAEFHATLDDSEKAMLDELTVAGLTAPEPEVSGFSFSSTPSLSNHLISQAPDTTGKYYYYYRVVADGMSGLGLRAR